MDALIKRVYELFEANAAVFTELDLPAVKTIDRYRGQTINPEQFEIYDIPAVFIGWRITWKQEGKTNVGDCSVDFHIVTDEPWNTGNIFTGFEDALNKAFFHKVVQKLLDDLESVETTKLKRSTDTPVDTGVICYTILTYNCKVYDNPGDADTITVGDLTINITGKHLKKSIANQA